MNIPKKFSAWLTVNRDCNLRCQWCYSRATSSTSMMPLDLARDVIAFFAQLPIKYVILIGGEPTIYPYFLEVIAEIKKKGMLSAVVTNGIKFADTDFLDDAINAGVYAITTSLKAGTEEEYERLAGRRALKETIQAVSNITKRGVRHKISITLGGKIKSIFDDILEVLKKSGTEAFTLSFERPVIVGDEVLFDDSSNVKEMSYFVQEIYPKLRKLGIRFTLTMTMPLCWYPEEFLVLLEKRKELSTGCQLLAKEGLVIDPEGYLIPCNHFCQHPLAKFGKDFRNGGEYYELRKREDVSRFYRLITKPPAKRCYTCSKWSKCGAGCRLYWLYQGADNLIPPPDYERSRLYDQQSIATCEKAVCPESD